MLFVLFFIYVLVAIRIAIELILLMRRARRSPEYRPLLLSLMRRFPAAVFLWPLDFVRIPRIFIQAYLFCHLQSMLKLGFYYGQKK